MSIKYKAIALQLGNHISPSTQRFIVSEFFFWSSWNAVLPVLSLFLLRTIPGTTFAQASTPYAAFLLSRVVASTLFKKKVNHIHTVHMIYFIMAGNFILSIIYLSMTIPTSLSVMNLLHCVLGCVFGISAPLKSKFFTNHLNKKYASMTAGRYDNMGFIAMGLSALFGGYVITFFGFQTLFSLASFLGIISIYPYLHLLQVYLHHSNTSNYLKKR